ncbi:hypothetical protein EW146_g10221 [Bondarzewia mesenterica]|uniref:Uncharacterized protein n=1 Tax=Bondarzewia mesenterica TaxID=1095465 RepID=A0A4S4KZD9_9AGAM|nr:hypothetical protein EW146_g10221 [Bondarzewia mesenterica]
MEPRSHILLAFRASTKKRSSVLSPLKNGYIILCITPVGTLVDPPPAPTNNSTSTTNYTHTYVSKPLEALQHTTPIDNHISLASNRSLAGPSKIAVPFPDSCHLNPFVAKYTVAPSSFAPSTAPIQVEMPFLHSPSRHFGIRFIDRLRVSPLWRT